MMRLNLVLLLAVVVSALYLVETQYQSRSVFIALERAKSEAKRLAAEHDRLEVERRAQATPARVEQLARESLHMHTVTPAITQYSTPQAAASQAQGAR